MKYPQLFSLLFLLSIQSLAHASSVPKSTLDRTVLTSDAILVGTVFSLAEVSDGIIEVELGDLHPVVTRWSLGSAISFRIRASFNSSGQVSAMQDQPPLVVGSRYLLFFKGGSFRTAPLIETAAAIYEIDKNDVVRCAGGEVYGLNPGGLACSTRSREVRAPLNEVSIVHRLRAYTIEARLRRPALALEADSNSLPLEILEAP